jgi:hypothetical protein
VLEDQLVDGVIVGQQLQALSSVLSCRSSAAKSWGVGTSWSWKRHEQEPLGRDR